MSFRNQGSNWIRVTTRARIYQRDSYTCLVCSVAEYTLSLDHFIARCFGGTNRPSNLYTCCKSCNDLKRGLDVHGWYRELRAQGASQTETRAINSRIRKHLRAELPLTGSVVSY